MPNFPFDYPADTYVQIQAGKVWSLTFNHLSYATMSEGDVKAFPVQAQLNGVDWGPEFTIYVKSSRPLPV